MNVETHVCNALLMAGLEPPEAQAAVDLVKKRMEETGFWAEDVSEQLPTFLDSVYKAGRAAAIEQVIGDGDAPRALLFALGELRRTAEAN